MEILHDFAQPKPYVLEAVKTLRERGIQIGSTTGYTDEMMRIVVPEAERQGYRPDAWFSPDSVNKMGRPYPFMIFKNLEALRISSVSAAIKVGDTTADIKEGKNAGLLSIGVIEGSSRHGAVRSRIQCAVPRGKARLSCPGYQNLSGLRCRLCHRQYEQSAGSHRPDSTTIAHRKFI